MTATNPVIAVEISAIDLPGGVLLERYKVEGGYVDCFVAELPRAVSLAQLIEAFYTSPAFLPERWLLGALLRKKADDREARLLAIDAVRNFSAWTVEERREMEILLCDFQSRTRSWLMALPVEGGTRLLFGSALVPARSRTDKIATQALLGFHRWYSRVLLKGAISRL